MGQELSNRTDVRELVEKIVRALVDHPEMVWVDEIVGCHTTVLVVRSDDPEAARQMIGRDGMYAWAIRRILIAISGKHHRSYLLEEIG